MWTNLKILRLLRGVSWWYDFFKTNNVRICIEDGNGIETFKKGIAMDMVGGLLVLTERSMPLNNYSYKEIRPAHVAFLSGPHSLRQIARPECVQQKIIIGHYYDRMHEKDVLKEQTLTLHRKLEEIGASKNKPLILVCDEGGMLYGKEHVIYFYQKLIEDLQRKGGYALLLKPKKEGFLKRLPEYLTEQIALMVERKRCFVLEPFASVSLGVSVADLVISLPSTSMFTSIAMGKRTVIFNPFKTIRNLFYKQGLEDKCIFTDIVILLKNFHKYLMGLNRSFGDCRAVYEQIEPFGDGKAGERITYFLNVLMKNLMIDSSSEAALELTKAVYLGKYTNKKGT
jgi:hypothetical protein